MNANGEQVLMVRMGSVSLVWVDRQCATGESG